MIARLFSRAWWWKTLIVLAAMAVMIRLGFWQLDRLEQRQAFNAHLSEQMQQPPLVLTEQTFEAPLTEMEYRQVIVHGEFLYAEEIALRNQYWENQWGVHLVTPLRIENSQTAVLVDRGWIPAEAFTSGDWSAFSTPGVVTVQGIIRRSQSKADFGMRGDDPPAPEGPRQVAWNFVNIPWIQQQTSVELLPIYIQQAPEAGQQTLPYRALPELELSEGPHLGYALQWFTFALILGVGYPFLLRQQDKRSAPNHPITPSQALEAKKANAHPSDLPHS